MAIPIALYLGSQVVTYLSRASGITANLVVDTGFARSVPLVWKNLAQGGEEKGRSLAPVVEKIRPLGIEYVRIDHVFDMYNVISKDGVGQINFNWTELDATIADIQSMGARPFIALSYMPPGVSRSANNTDLPANWSDWELIVQRTIEHISGQLNIPEVYYEVWNEPDLFGDYKVYGDKNYLELYSHSAAGAARASGVQPFKFGGPATTALYESWVRGVLKLAEENGIRLDFVSWHHYSKNLEDFEKDLFEIQTWGADYVKFRNVELLITEMGPNSENDPVYDSSFGTIHTIATAAVLDGKINRAFNFEIKDGPGDKQYWGRWGIFTHEKYGDPVAKPRFNAFTFLNRLSGRKINVAGEGSWVKAIGRKDDANRIQLMVVNYDPGGRHSEAVPIKYINLPSGNFTYRRTDFTGARREIEVATSSAEWATMELMTPNSATIFEIVPK